MKELDRVLGGGVVRGSMVLVGGDPGIEKSTFFASGLQGSAEHNIKMNSMFRGGMLCDRSQNPCWRNRRSLGDSLKLLCETNLDCYHKGSLTGKNHRSL